MYLAQPLESTWKLWLQIADACPLHSISSRKHTMLVLWEFNGLLLALGYISRSYWSTGTSLTAWLLGRPLLYLLSLHIRPSDALQLTEFILCVDSWCQSTLSWSLPPTLEFSSLLGTTKHCTKSDDLSATVHGPSLFSSVSLKVCVGGVNHCLFVGQHPFFLLFVIAAKIYNVVFSILLYSVR